MKWPSGEQWLFAFNLLLQPVFGFARRTKIRTILIVKWDEIGDMATSTHIFRHLKTEHPDASVTLLCKPFVRDLVINDPHLDHIICSEEEWNCRYDVVAELRGTWKTALKSLRFPPNIRVTRARARWLNRGQQKHETETNFEIIRPLLQPGSKAFSPQLYYSADDRKKVDSFLQQQGVRSPYAVFHIGARRKLRQWPSDRFAKLATYVHQRYQLDIVFIGKGDELDVVDQILPGLDFAAKVFPDDAGLSALSCLISGAAFFAGNESGPLHIAAAFEIPSVAMFGPGVPRVFYPTHKASVVLHHILSCNPCDQVHCVQPESPCINLISMEEAVSAADSLLGT